MSSITEINEDATKPTNKRKGSSSNTSTDLARARKESKSINMNRIQWRQKLDDDFKKETTKPKKQNDYTAKMEARIQPILQDLESLPDPTLTEQIKALTASTLSSKIAIKNKRETMSTTIKKKLGSTNIKIALGGSDEVKATTEWKALHNKFNAYIEEFKNNIKKDYILPSHNIELNMKIKQLQDKFFTGLHDALLVFARYYKILSENEPHNLTEKQTAQLVIESIFEEISKTNPPPSPEKEKEQVIEILEQEANDEISTYNETTNNIISTFTSPTSLPNNNSSQDISGITTNTPLDLYDPNKPKPTEQQYNNNRLLQWLETKSTTEAFNILTHQSFHREIDEKLTDESKLPIIATANKKLIQTIKETIFPIIIHSITWKVMDKHNENNQRINLSKKTF